MGERSSIWKRWFERSGGGIGFSGAQAIVLKSRKRIGKGPVDEGIELDVLWRPGNKRRPRR